MKIERAIEILDPEHQECYDGMDEVNEACRMGATLQRYPHHRLDGVGYSVVDADA